MQRSIRASFPNPNIFSVFICACGRGSAGAENEHWTVKPELYGARCIPVLQMSVFVAASSKFVPPRWKTRTRDQCTVRWPNVNKKINKKKDDIKICIGELEKIRLSPSLCKRCINRQPMLCDSFRFLLCD